MMKILLFVALQIVWSYGSSDSNGINGGGAFAYSDSQGNRFPAFGNFERFGYQPPNFNFAMPGYNSAAAGAAIGPGYRHQYASIYPTNPGMPNVNEFINRMSDTASGPNQYSVSSSSYASSSNINGKETSQRGGETIVNDNGKITKYKVNN